MSDGVHTAPLVSVIVVNWNGLADTLECLDSLLTCHFPPSCPVIVVDNGSAEGEAQALRSEYPGGRAGDGAQLRLHRGQQRRDQTRARPGANYILCLNNDTSSPSTFWSRLVVALEQDREAGIATGAVFYTDRPEQLSALGNWVDLSEVGPAGTSMRITRSAAHNCRWRRRQVAEVPAVTGCVLLMRRAVAEATGGFDDAFFAYMEDIDLCLRARRLGWRCLAVPASRVWHKIGSTTGGENFATAMHYGIRNSRRLVRRHGTPRERRLFAARLPTHGRRPGSLSAGRAGRPRGLAGGARRAAYSLAP